MNESLNFNSMNAKDIIIKYCQLNNFHMEYVTLEGFKFEWKKILDICQFFGLLATL